MTSGKGKITETRTYIIVSRNCDQEINRRKRW